jgi:ribosomal protein L29
MEGYGKFTVVTDKAYEEMKQEIRQLKLDNLALRLKLTNEELRANRLVDTIRKIRNATYDAFHN